MENVDVLTIAAHSDDIELTCSGTLIKMVDKGYSVGILDLTQGEMGTRGTAELRCSGAGSCPSTVSCSGLKCTILCNPNQSCGGSVCCQSSSCVYMGTDRRCP